MKFILTSLFLMSVFLLSAQDTLIINGHFPNFPNSTYELKGYDGIEQETLSSAISLEDGKFALNYPKAYKGVAQLWMNGAYLVLLFLNQENITLYWEDLTNREDLKTNSKEYEAFLSGMKTYQDSEAKLVGLHYLIPLYAQDSLKQSIFVKELDSVANTFPTYVKSLPERLFVRQYLLTKGLIEQMPKTVETYKWRAPAHVQEFMAIDFNSLKHSGLYGEVINGYTHLVERFPQEEVNPLLEAAINKLVTELQTEPQVLKAIAQYWIPILEKKSLYKSAEYLTKAMISKENTCKAKNKDTRILNQHCKLAIGRTAPDITFTETTYFPQGNTAKKLSELHAEKYLLVFAAGWCPHCTEEIPKVATMYPDLKAKGIEVVLVSLDETTQDFAQFAAPFPFISTTDLQKWESQAVKDYHVYATPSYFMLDKDLKIVGKYSSLEGVLRD